jgi:hypothetical protein
MRKLRLGRWRCHEGLRWSTLVLAALAPLLAAGISALALPVTAAAATASTATPVVAPRLVVLASSFCGKVGRFINRIVPDRGLILDAQIFDAPILGAQIVGWFGDRNVLDMVLLPGAYVIAAATPAPSPAPPSARPAVGRFGCCGACRLNLGVAFDFAVVDCAADLFEIVALLERRDRSLRPFGDRLGGFDRMHLFATLDEKSLRRAHGFVRGDRDGDRKAFLKPTQMRTLLIKEIKRNIRPRACDQVVRSAFDEMLFKCSQYLQGQR